MHAHTYRNIFIGFAANHPELAKEFNLIHHATTDDDSLGCKKNLGQSKRLRHWSRGHLFVCRPCGHIDFSQPIYRYNYAHTYVIYG